MSCCAAEQKTVETIGRRPADETLLASRRLGGGLHQTSLSVPAIHCGGCVQRIERTLSALPNVETARVNLSTKRASVTWKGDAPPPLLESLKGIGFDAHLHDAEPEASDPGLSEMIRALAVAGFAASNIMLLSVSIWSGAATETRDLFHWLSAAIALPTLAYSGRIFFRSAWNALRHGRTNMDVPISIGVLLAFGLSLYETVNHGPHAYFDASVSLLFFLLIGRTLDYVMRDRARVAVKSLARLAARGAYVVSADGTERYLPIQEIAPGMMLRISPGDRIPVDGTIAAGKSDLDCSLISGESAPRAAAAGDMLRAGMLNLTGPLTITATAAAKDSFLADMLRMMEAAESGRSRYRRISDRASRLYAPVVHLAAFLTFLGWMLATGDLHRAITIAVAVLIITCPCALGLAVPMVQVVAARRLFERGIMVKDGSGLERLAEVNQVLFDKTGTLTTGNPQLVDTGVAPETLALAAGIAAHSRHPYSRALAASAAQKRTLPPAAVSEHAGNGVEAKIGGDVFRLGRPEWVLATGTTAPENTSVVLGKNGQLLAAFEFTDRLRRDAAAAVEQLKKQGLPVEILSGDRDRPAKEIAGALGVPYIAELTPAGKTARIAALKADGKQSLMVGDGLNDAPALAAAHTSMAPATAADVGRNAADLVFLHESLLAVPDAIAIAKNADMLVRQNLLLSVVYNAVAMPIAVAGFVTPLVAAIAMSVSSLIVIVNALRLRGRKPSQGEQAPAFAHRTAEA
ncbi:MAG: cation-translocating P-type ATPase [Xanthobacteraceae bacterium]